MVHLLFKHSKLIFVWGVIFAILAGLVSLLFPKYYSAESQLLLISRGYSGVDPYTQAKAAERIGENLMQIIKTADFYSKVLELQSTTFDRERWLSMSERARRKAWARDVRAETVYGTSILKLFVYSKDKNDTLALSQAVTETVASRGWEYVGGEIAIKAVNSPLVSYLPTRPNYLVNSALGFVLGILLSVWWVWRNKRGVFGGI